MAIHLSEQREQLILSLLRAGKFAPADEVVDEGLRLVEQRLRESGEKNEAASSGMTDHPDDRAPVQLRNLSRLGQLLDAMPAAAIADGLSNRDHDRMLYGQ
jgi:Arc/MetJ-type ribon-helix-helix transcriptional regulator